MAVATLHVLHGIQTPTQFYSQVEQATPSPAVEAVLGRGEGFAQPLFRGIKGAKPEVRFSTTQLATLITECGLFGADLTAGNCDLWYRKAKARGVYEADASPVHTRLRMVDAFFYWSSLRASHEGADASADARIIAEYDGTNAPIAAAGTTALAGTPTAAEYFSLGPVTINGSTHDGDVDLTLDLGVETREAGSNSEGYPTFVGIRAINPIVTLRGYAVESWVNYGLVGTALTGLTFYLRRVKPDAGGAVAYYANGDPQHIKFVATAGLITVGETTGGGMADAMTTLRLLLRAPNAAGNALTVTTAQTIV